MVREARGQSRTDENHRGLRECSLRRYSGVQIIRVDMMKIDWEIIHILVAISALILIWALGLI